MPTPAQVHVDVALTHVSLAHRNAGFIAERVAPPVSVRKQSGKYFVYDPEREAMRKMVDLRAPGAEAAEIGFNLSQDSYFAADHALESIIPDEERENADPAIQPDIDHTEFLIDKIGLNQEILLVDAILANSSIPNSTLSGDTQWSDVDSDPIGEIESRKRDIVEASQTLPNVLVLPYDVFSMLRVHPDIVDRVKYSNGGGVSADALARLFDIAQVVVARAVKNTATAGQTPAIDYVWGKNALLCHAPERPGLKQPAFAYTFRWSLAPGSVEGHVVEAWREPSRKSDMIRVQKYYDMKIVAPTAAYLWKAAVA